jgi:hypothetical protein
MLPEIQQAWRKSLVSKLHEHYGLAPEEARTKADAWLQWLTQDAQLNTTIEVRSDLARPSPTNDHRPTPQASNWAADR